MTTLTEGVVDPTENENNPEKTNLNTVDPLKVC